MLFSPKGRTIIACFFASNVVVILATSLRTLVVLHITCARSKDVIFRPPAVGFLRPLTSGIEEDILPTEEGSLIMQFLLVFVAECFDLPAFLRRWFLKRVSSTT